MYLDVLSGTQKRLIIDYLYTIRTLIHLLFYFQYFRIEPLRVSIGIGFFSYVSY